MTAAAGGVFHYSARSLAGDYAQALIGVACTLGPLALAQPAPVVGWILGATGVLFLVYFGRTVCRQLTRVELDEAGIRVRGPLGATIRWDRLCALRLDYYSTRADREGGWMQLRLGDGQRTLRIDSGLEGFAELARAAARVAARRALALDAATAANLEVLGD
jgi:hypothetical protein